MLLNIFSEYFNKFTDWGISQVLAIILSIIIIGLSLPFTYVGYSIRKAIGLRIKRFKGFAVKKYTVHAIISTVFLLILEVVLFFTLNVEIFNSISFILSLMVLLGLMGVKLTFSLEEMIDGWVDDMFSKD
jgi:hypothetical protein